MDNKTRAEKIVSEMPDYARDQIPFIAAQIEEAVREAAFDARVKMREDLVYDEGVAWGFADAREMAAKWIEEHCQFVECEIECLCAKEIRALPIPSQETKI